MFRDPRTSLQNGQFTTAGFSDLADLLFKERTIAAQRTGLKIRDQAQRDERGELAEDVELTADEQAALLALLDLLPDVSSVKFSFANAGLSEDDA